MSAQSPMTHSKASADRLGGTMTIGGDMTVHRLGFGAMRLSGPGVWGEPLDPAAAKRVLTHALELGITLIDTADAYGPEVNAIYRRNALSLVRRTRCCDGRSDAPPARDLGQKRPARASARHM
jgi:hypothetical protein